jgi:hypothetical protein
MFKKLLLSAALCVGAIAPACGAQLQPILPSIQAWGVYSLTPPTLIDQQIWGLTLDASAALRVDCIAGCTGSGGGTVSAQYNTSLPNYTTNQATAPLQVGSNGALYVNTVAGQALNVAFLSTPNVALSSGIGTSSGTPLFVSTTNTSTPQAITTDGTAATGVVQLSGAAGAIGWLSGIFSKLASINTALGNTLSTQIAAGPGFASGTPLYESQINGPGANSNGTGQFLGTCDKFNSQIIASATASLVVSHIAGKTIYVCGWDFVGNAGTSSTIGWETGTGTNCGTGTATPATVPQARSFVAQSGLSTGDHLGGFTVSGGVNDACIVVAGTSPSVTVDVWYAVY